MPNFTVDFETFERLGEIALKKGTNLEKIFNQLENMLKNDVNLLGQESPLVTEKLVRGRPRGKQAEKKQFIKDNYNNMTDEQLAQELSISVQTVITYRRSMGLKRVKPSANTVQAILPTELTEEQKIFVQNNLSLSNKELSRKFGLKKKLVSAYRVHLIKTYIMSEEGKDKSNLYVSVKYRLSPSIIGEIRETAGLQNPKRNYNVDLSVIGDREQILFLLTRGGKTATDLIREYDLQISRRGLEVALSSRLQIIVGVFDHTHEWYARKCAGKNDELYARLIDIPWLKQKLATTPISALANEIGVNSEWLRSYLKNKLKIDMSAVIGNKKITELSCTNCTKTFFRPTSIIKRDRKVYPNKKPFCSRLCLGKYTGENFGFIAHPENAGRKQKKKNT